MPRFEKTRKDLNDLISKRAGYLQEAEDLRAKGNTAEASSALARAKELNPRIDELQDLVTEADRYANDHAPKFGTDRQDMEEMGRALAAGERVRISVVDTLAGLRRDAGTLASGSVVMPQGGGSEIHDGHHAHVSALIDQVNTVQLNGLGSWEEPYVVSDPVAVGNAVKNIAGKARSETDPAFAKAKLASYEASVTSFVDRNIGRLSPADYAAKVQAMALRGLRRKVGSLIINGDGQASPEMFGFLNAKNTDGNNIFSTIDDIQAIDVNTLDRLVFGYGGDEIVGANARLVLSKSNLRAFGALRGTNEKKRLYKITVDPGSPTTGTIEDGGLIVPYTISASIGDNKLAYGDPFNYMLGLFGDYVIRVDESVKAVERMIAVLGDVLVGGNLTVDKGMVIGTITGGQA